MSYKLVSRTIFALYTAFLILAFLAAFNSKTTDPFVYLPLMVLGCPWFFVLDGIRIGFLSGLSISKIAIVFSALLNYGLVMYLLFGATKKKKSQSAGAPSPRGLDERMDGKNEV